MIFIQLTVKHGAILVNMDKVVAIEPVGGVEFYKSRLIYGPHFADLVKESVEEINNMIDKEIKFYAKLK